MTTGAAQARAADEVQNHYNRFPFPKAAEILWNPWLRWELNTLAGRWATTPIPEDCRILIAGCGTIETLLWAKSFPRAQVYGVDLSAASIAITQSLIEQLHVGNARVEQRSLLELDAADGEFDLISSYGVLHHLPDPPAGLKVLCARLKPGGVINLMLYNRRNRYFLAEFQSLVGLLSTDDSAESRERIGAALTRDMRAANTRLEAPQHFARLHFKNNRPFWADACIHPLEHDYDLTELFELLSATRLQLLSWRNHFKWHVEPWLNSPQLREAYTRLPRHAQWEVADRLRMPLFELLCGRDEDAPPQRPWETDDDALLGMVFVNPAIHRLAVKSNVAEKVSTTARTCYLEEVRGQPQLVQLRTPGDLELTVHVFFKTLLESLDGERTLRQAAECAARRFGVEFPAIRQTVVETFRKLLNPHQALACCPRELC